MPIVFSDLKFALRQLRKSPGFTATAVLMLAFGIGATTAIFSIIEGVLLRPLPFPNSNRLVSLGDVIQGVNLGVDSSDQIVSVTAPDILNYTRDTHSFESLGGYTQTAFEFSATGEPAQIMAARMSPGVFRALSVQPLLGRVFTQEEDEHKAQVAVLSYSLWRERFHGDPHVLGTKILLDRNPYIVIGVMPRNFEFPLIPGHMNQSRLWVPMSFTRQELTTGAASWDFNMIGRMKPGVTPIQAELDAERVAQETMRNYPAWMAGLHISARVQPLREVTVQQARPLIRTLFLAVLVVLLIACANLAGLLLVRAIRRRREIAVRLALGARASALLRQALLEGLALSVTGGLLGLLLAYIALHAGLNLLPETLPRINDIAIRWQVVTFSLLLAIVTGAGCALVPAFADLRTNVNDTLKEGGRTGTSGSGHARLRSSLVVAEIAVAMVLLAASGLLLRSFEKMRNVNLGFSPDHILSASYSLPQKQYSTQAQVNAFNNELVRRLRAMPGIAGVGLTSLLPASGANSNSAYIADNSARKDPHQITLGTPSLVVGAYFRAMQIPLLRGRLFTEDDNDRSPLVVIVNRKLAEDAWPGQDPIGKRIRFGTQQMKTPWLTVAGEVANIKQGSPDLPDRPQFYQPVEQFETAIGSLASPSDLNGNGGYIVLRTALPPEQITRDLFATVHSLDSQLPLTQVQTMERTVSDSEAPRRFDTVIITAFAAAAILLAVLGIYSVIAFSVALRLQEMAIRMALGSRRSGILRLILLSGGKLAAVGCILGLFATLATSQLVKSFLFGVTPFDPLTLAVATILVLLLAVGASLLPAQRAASINPMQALRDE